MTPFLLSVSDVSILVNESARTIRDRCKKGAYQTATFTGNGGPQYRIHLASLPEPAQVKYWLERMGDSFPPDTPPDALRQWALSLHLEPSVHQQLLKKAGLTLAEPDPLAWSPEESASRHEAFIRLPTWKQDRAREQAHLVRGFASAKRKAPPGGEVAAAEAYAEANDTSVPTLYRLLKQVGHLNPHDWELGLVPGWHGGKKRTEIHPDLWTYIKAEYLVKSKPTIRSVYRRATRMATKHGLTIPSYGVVKARLHEEDRQKVILMRDGDTALDQTFPHIKRDFSTLDLHEKWNADGRKGDVWTVWPDGDTLRPVYVLWIDLASRYALGYSIGKGENVDLVRKSFANALAHAGNCLPQVAYLDNGAAFASKEFTGGQAKRNRFKVKEGEIDGILTSMNIKAQWATPGHGQAKPIESFWNTIRREVDQCADFVKAYCGSSPKDRPEGIDPQKHPIPIGQYRAELDRAIYEYNRRPHRGVGMGNKSPLQVYTERHASTLVRVATAEQLKRLLLVPRQVFLNNKNQSFVINDNAYWHEALTKLKSNGPYTAYYDATDASMPVQLFDGAAFVCAAELWQIGGAKDLESTKDAIRAKRKKVRAIKEMRDADRAEQKALDWHKPKAPAAPGAGNAGVLPAPKVMEPLRPAKKNKPAQVALDAPDELSAEEFRKARDRGLEQMLALRGEEEIEPFSKPRRMAGGW